MIRSEGKYIHSNEDIFMILFVSPWNQATLVHTKRIEGLFYVMPEQCSIIHTLSHPPVLFCFVFLILARMHFFATFRRRLGRMQGEKAVFLNSKEKA